MKTSGISKTRRNVVVASDSLAKNSIVDINKKKLPVILRECKDSIILKQNYFIQYIKLHENGLVSLI